MDGQPESDNVPRTSMAAVFQRPMPVLDDAQDNQIRQQRRRRDSVEVIDVDELDDVYLPHRAPEPGPSRPAQRRRISTPSEIISLLDSDDDDLVISASSIRPASRTRLQSPPPRNQPWSYVPPVPPVPHRYAGHTSLPMRRQGPAFASPPVVRPSEEPFPFEANMRQQQPQHHPAPVPGPGPSNRPPPIHIPRGNVPNILPPRPLQQAAPPSHHVPALGLGGALIAQNRARQQHQHRPHLSYEPGNSFFGRVGSGVRRILGGPALAPEEGPRNAINFLALGNNWGFLDDPLSDDDELLAIQALAEDEGEGFRDLEPAFNPARAYIRSEVFRRRNNAREESPYRKEYTHPGPPETGFSFDFAPKSPVEVIDVTSPEFPKKRISSPEPIIIDDEDDSIIHDVNINTSKSTITTTSSASIPSSSKQTPQTPPKSSTAGTTVLACARCLDPLVLSNNLTSDVQKNRRVWGLRCGHLIDGKCLKEIGQPRYTDQSTDVGGGASIVDRKGKGKAKAASDESVSHDEGMQILAAYDHEQPDNNANSIRSRLRPRHVAAPVAAAPSSSSNPTAKRNARGKQPQLPPPEYLWHCPVTGCGRIHVSLKINGEWVPEREELTSGPSGSGAGGRGRGRGAGRGRGRTSLFGILNADGDQPHQPPQPHASEGARGAIPLFL